MALQDKTIGASENTAITTVTTTVLLNSLTATTIVEALADDDPNHIKIFIDNASTKDVVIKFQAAGVDNLLIGQTIRRFSGATILELPNVYRGEISAIATNDAPTITIIEQ